jgi:hypothetical protein
MTTTLLEAILFGVGLGSFAVTGVSLSRAMRDKRALELSRINGLRKLTIRARWWRELLRGVAASIILITSVWLLYLPSDTDPVSLICKHALMFVAILLMVTTIVDATSRTKLDHLLEKLVASAEHKSSTDTQTNSHK